MIVPRAEVDFFRIPHVDIMVNPVNTLGISGKGLALEFKTRHPDMYVDYKERCDEGTFGIGKICAFKPQGVSYEVVCIATKRHWADASDIKDIKEGIRAFRDHLLKRPLFTVAMPMLGCGLGQRDYTDVAPLMYEYLDDLKNIIHLSQVPQSFKKLPKYLGVIGSERYNTPYTDYLVPSIRGILSKNQASLDDFDAIVTRDTPGISREIIAYTKSIGKRCILVPEDVKRYGRTAPLIRDKIIADIATHMLLYPDNKSVRTYMLADHIQDMNKKTADVTKKTWIHITKLP